MYPAPKVASTTPISKVRLCNFPACHARMRAVKSTYRLVKKAETAGDMPSRPIIWKTNPPVIKRARIIPSFQTWNPFTSPIMEGEIRRNRITATPNLRVTKSVDTMYFGSPLVYGAEASSAFLSQTKVQPQIIVTVSYSHLKLHTIWSV